MHARRRAPVAGQPPVRAAAGVIVAAAPFLAVPLGNLSLPARLGQAVAAQQAELTRVQIQPQASRILGIIVNLVGETRRRLCQTTPRSPQCIESLGRGRYRLARREGRVRLHAGRRPHANLQEERTSVEDIRAKVKLDCEDAVDHSDIFQFNRRAQRRAIIGLLKEVELQVIEAIRRPPGVEQSTLIRDRGDRGWRQGHKMVFLSQTGADSQSQNDEGNADEGNIPMSLHGVTLLSPSALTGHAEKAALHVHARETGKRRYRCGRFATYYDAAPAGGDTTPCRLGHPPNARTKMTQDGRFVLRPLCRPYRMCQKSKYCRASYPMSTNHNQRNSACDSRIRSRFSAMGKPATRSGSSPFISRACRYSRPPADTT